ncbi:hypothetical protein [Streptomyces sp. NPDC086182]|jgi:hypothetical protein|uniref:hypothetical protein n=1 Tax=Streptomyces sp. NPDC086182 TaxID=3155058 RepID=UPI003418E94B
MGTAGQQNGPDRRALLRAAVAVPAVGAAAVAFEAAPARAATTGRGGRFDTESPRFALAVLPDTQYLFNRPTPASTSTAARARTAAPS